MESRDDSPASIVHSHDRTASKDDWSALNSFFEEPYVDVVSPISAMCDKCRPIIPCTPKRPYYSILTTSNYDADLQQ
jgi:hypothetical protein